MKRLLFVFFIFICNTIHAKSYYISPAGSDVNSGTSPASPWQTISKANSFTFALNDSILFKRGGIFYGSIVVRGANLNFGAYGIGAKPIITGLSIITGWVNLGGNIWEAPAIGVKASNNLVLRDGKIMQVGRYPNANATEAGYLIYTGATTSSITGPALSTTKNWTGAEVAIRLNRWEILRKTVTAHSGGTINFTAHSSAPRLNYGYFFQRDPRTLDQDGEWWQDGINNKLRMYFSNNNPSAYSIQASTIDILISNSAGYYNNVSINDLSFIGAGKKAIYILSGANQRVKNCDVNNSGAEAISIFSASNVVVDNCTTRNSLGSGIQVSNSSNTTLSSIKNCTVDSTALIAGMETSDENNGGNGILNRGGNNIYVTNCSVLNSGYVGISWFGNDAFIKYNLVDTYCKVRDDGAGIYTAERRDTLLYAKRFNRNVVRNIVVNGIGQGFGTSSEDNESAVNGIYVDDGAADVLIDSNTVAYIPVAGVHGNNNRRITITNNTTFNTGFGFSFQRFNFGQTITGMRVTKNIFYPYRFQYRNLARDKPIITTLQDLQGVGIVDSNYYSLRAITDTSFKTVTTLYNGTGYVEQNLPFSYLTSTVGFEKKAINIPNTGRLEYNASNSPKVITFSGLSKKDVLGNVYDNSVTIPAWSSKILISNGLVVVPNIAPVANAGADIQITLPTNITSLNGSGTDTDGIITSYKWAKIAGPVSGTIVSPNSAVTSVSSVIDGLYLFELTVQDDKGTIDKDTVKLTVNVAANQPPVADAGADQVIDLPINTTTLTGTGIDFDGTITSYSWVKISGPNGGALLSPNSSSTGINNLEVGEYFYELSVTDNNGATTADTILIRVDATINKPPAADAGINQVVTLPTNSTFLKGTGTDADGSVANYSWVKISGPALGVIVSPGNDSTTISNLEQGTYIFELTVTDNHGAISSDIVQVIVNTGSIQAPPIANAGTDQVINLPIDSALLTGVGTDLDGTVTSYKWVKISGPVLGSITSPNAAATTIVSLVQGVYQYRLTVADSAGASAKDTVTITVVAAPNRPPVASAGLDISITLPTNSTSIAGAGLDVDGTISSYDWVKIAGPVEGIISSPNSAYTSVYNLVQGVYKFELTVKDDKGLYSKDTIEITVNAGVNQVPEADAGTDQIIELPINTTTLTGSGTDFDGTIITHSWAQISGPTGVTILSPDSASTLLNNLVAGIFHFELTVTDNNGAITADTIEITVNEAAKQLPVADAGANQLITLPVNSVTLTGSGTDADGTVISYSWTKISGPAAEVLVSSNASSTLVNNLAQGFYEFKLTVTDNDGLASTDTITVTVNDSLNKAPVANAGTKKVISLPTNSTTLAGSGTDSDGFITGFLWEKISGPTQPVIESPNSAVTVINNLVQGGYKFELTVTDNNGAISKDIVQVTVNSGQNQLPIANAGLDKVIVLPTNNTTLTGIGTDADGTITSYKWLKISGNAAGVIGSSNSATTTVSNLVQGANQYQLSVTDNKGAVTKDTVKITVNAAPNQVPKANAGADKIITLPTSNITLNGAGTDADGTIAIFAWEKIMGPVSATIASPNSPITSIFNLQQGVYQFVLTVKDNNGAFFKDTVKVTVNPAPNQAPIADAGLNQIIRLPLNNVNLTGSGTDADGTITSYTWAKITGPVAGNIISKNSASTLVNGLVQGLYEFELTVKDNLNAISIDTIKVTVNPAPNQTPVAEAGLNKVIILPVNNSTLSGTGTDTDGTIISFLWKQIAGPASGVIVSPTNANTIINNLIQGVYRYELKVTDNKGATSTDIVQVTVNAGINIIPTAIAGADKTLTLPTNNISLTGSGIDADGTITGYKWLKISGAASGTITSPNANNTTITNLVQGVYLFQLTVTDNSGASSKDTIKVTVNAAPNQPPSLNAGIDKIITLPTNFLTLSGTGTDADGTISSYIWAKISGPAAGSITSPNSSNTAVTNLVEAVYQFQLTVTDNNGATSKDTVKITVNAALNQLPLSNADADKTITLPVNYVTLTGMGTDLDGTISGYTWIKISGPAAGTIASQNSGITDVTNLVAGVYQYELTVKDNKGAVGKDTVLVTVNDAPAINQLPTAYAGADISVVLPTNDTILKGKGTDTDGTIVAYNWRVIDGPLNYILSSQDQAETKIKNLLSGVYEIEFAVSDNTGDIVKDTMQLTVSSSRLSDTTYSINEFKVYPNPVFDIATISITTINANTKVYLSLLDVSGKLVINKEYITAQRDTFLKVDMSNLSNGYYILVLKFDDGRTISTKVMKNGNN